MGRSSENQENESGAPHSPESPSVKRGAIPSPASALEEAMPYVPPDDEDSSSEAGEHKK